MNNSLVRTAKKLPPIELTSIVHSSAASSTGTKYAMGSSSYAMSPSLSIEGMAISGTLRIDGDGLATIIDGRVVSAAQAVSRTGRAM